MNAVLKKLKDKKSMTYEQYRQLYVNNATIPLFYSLVKTHKPNLPIRPIVSFIDSPTY